MPHRLAGRWLTHLAVVTALAMASDCTSLTVRAAGQAAEELTWSNDGVTLSGTLTLPAEPHKAPFRAVVLVSGSGSQNRDSEVAGFKLFAVLADHLARHGAGGAVAPGRGGTDPAARDARAHRVRSSTTWLGGSSRSRDCSVAVVRPVGRSRSRTSWVRLAFSRRQT